MGDKNREFNAFAQEILHLSNVSLMSLYVKEENQKNGFLLITLALFISDAYPTLKNTLTS